MRHSPASILAALMFVVACGSSDSDSQVVEQPGDDASPGAGGALEDASPGEDASADASAGGSAGQGTGGKAGQGTGGKGGQGTGGNGGQGTGGNGGQGTGGKGGQGTGGQGDGGASGQGGAAPYCGDAQVNAPAEQCDGYDFAGKSCASVLGVSSAKGSLTCSSSCTLSSENCHYCGDGIKNGYEQCDGSDLGGSSCATLMSGYTGTLKCSSSCFFDSAGCDVACTPDCSGKLCGSNGCGGVCGSCSGDATCDNGVCEQCTTSCPSLKTPSLPAAVQCTPTSHDCSGCGAASCGSARFAVTCGGAPVGTEYPKPDIPGCMWKYTNNFCCPAGCTRFNYFDTTCVSKDLPPVGRACTLGASLSPGCVQLTGYAAGGDYVPACCPQ